MTLSERLKAAEANRQAEARRAQPGDAFTPADDDAVLDLRASGTPLIDLGDGQPNWTFVETDQSGGMGIDYDPVRNGDASHAFGDAQTLAADRLSTVPCPRCGGTTQIDLFDQVHQMVSLSCNTCFHMFRVPVAEPPD